MVETPHGDSNQTELEYRLAWARTYLKKYGLLTNSERGIWALTSQGQATQQVSPEHVRDTVRKAHKKSKRTKRAPLAGEAPPLAEEVEAPWQDTLRQVIQKIKPDAFERLCQRLLRESGFIQVEVTGKSGDGGIDGHGIVRIAGLLSFPIIFQAKRYAGSVGAAEVRNFRGAMVGRADKGLFITTGSFTSSAYSEATHDGAPPIDLIDGQQLVEKLRELKLGVRTRTVEVVEVDRAFFAAV